MAHGEFVWSNLSSFRPEVTKRFYRKLFGWSYNEMRQPDGWPYHVAKAGDHEAASIFEMPRQFQDMRLASYWMPYIIVDNLDTACETAIKLGGKVELGPLAWNSQNQIVLLRDPLGAGFTIHQGNGFSPDPHEGWPGHRAWCSLVVSDAEEVAPFYRQLFDWDVRRDSTGFSVRTRDGKWVADITSLKDEMRGPFQFWGVYFAVHNVKKAARLAERQGGEILYEETTPSGPITLIGDPDGAAFFLIQLNS
ncbi:MAG: VOC family protein [Pseudomonadota bacterium]